MTNISLNMQTDVDVEMYHLFLFETLTCVERLIIGMCCDSMLDKLYDLLGTTSILNLLRNYSGINLFLLC